MTLTPQHIKLLKELAEKERYQSPPLLAGGEELERAGYIAITSPTRGEVSMLIIQITEAGRRALTAAGQ
jgi:hypothetical protein